jgi:hypothetical protein
VTFIARLLSRRPQLSKLRRNAGSSKLPAMKGAEAADARHTRRFAVYEIVLFATCIIFLGLGPYPYPAGGHAPAGAVVKAAA